MPSDVPDVVGQDLFDALAVAGGEVIHDGVVLGGSRLQLPRLCESSQP